MQQLADYKQDMEYAHGNPDIMMKIMFPYIEVLAYSLYSTKKYPIYELLKSFGIQYPSLFWKMYRCGVLHESYPKKVTYEGYTINWAIHNAKHTISSGYEYIEEGFGDVETIKFSEREFSYAINLWSLHSKVIEKLKIVSADGSAKEYVREEELRAIQINEIKEMIKKQESYS